MNLNNTPKKDSIINDIVDDALICVKDRNYNIVRLCDYDINHLREISGKILSKIDEINSGNIILVKKRSNPINEKVVKDTIEQLTNYPFEPIVREINGVSVEDMFPKNLLESLLNSSHDKKLFLVLLDPQNRFRIPYKEIKEYPINVGYLINNQN